MFILQTSRGFSLVELMASMAIMAVITLNLSTMMKNQEMGIIRTKAEYTMSGAVAEIGTMLSNPDVCLTNLGSLALNATTPTPLAIVTIDGVSKQIISKGPRSFIATADLNKAVFFGDGNLSIESFQVGDFVDSSPVGNGSANLIINFWKKGSKTQTIQKKIALGLTTDHAASDSILSCKALGFYDSSIAGTGIVTCPKFGQATEQMALVGDSGGRSTYCIDINTRSPDKYEFANKKLTTGGCANVVDTRLGAAHLCSFEEWSKACVLTKITPTGLEWIASAPTGNAVSGVSPMTAVGDPGSPGLNICFSAKIDADPESSYPFRCCFN